MKTVKEMCLGVAVAGVVAGAGSAVGCAVAYADSTGPDTATDTATAARADGAAAAGPRARSRAANQTATPARAAGRPTVATVAPRAAAATATRMADQITAALLASPTSPLRTPVLPASSVSLTSSPTTSRSRSASAVAEVSEVADAPVHVLLIGTDGTNMSHILSDPANVGFFDLMDESVTGTTTLVGHTTISNPSWSTILTGVWDTKTGVINNLFNPAPYYSWPTVFNQLEYFNSAIDTATVADWDVINDIAGAGSYPVNPADNFFIDFTNNWADTDQEVVNKTIDLINTTSTTSSSLLFSYQVQVDEAGHAYGGGSAEYRQAVTNVSDNIAEIMDAVAAREALTGEDWTVIVTTDHGHQQSVGFGHGFQSPNETSSFIIADLAGDSANDGNQNLGYSNVDITPTIVALFGAPLRSDFDGVPIQSNTAVLNSIVTPVNLNQALTDALGMYGYPNIGTDIALGTRTVFASIPYFLNGFVETITGQLQSIVDANIFLISTLAGVAEFAVQIVGDVLVGTTQALARVVATLTGSGVIPPSDPPLPPPTAAVLLPAAVLV